MKAATRSRGWYASLAALPALLLGATLALPGSAVAGGEPVGPCIDVQKFCTDAPDAYSPIGFTGSVTNCGDIDLETKVIDLVTGEVLVDVITLAPGQTVPFEGSYVPDKCGLSENQVLAKAYYYVWDDTKGTYNSVGVYDSASATCELPCSGGREGCTPGFWRNHAEDWPAGFAPTDSFIGVFGVDRGVETLWDAIWARGGFDNKIARHGTAALLNAASIYVEYPFSMLEVIEAVQQGDVERLVRANERETPGFCE